MSFAFFWWLGFLLPPANPFMLNPTKACEGTSSGLNRRICVGTVTFSGPPLFLFACLEMFLPPPAAPTDEPPVKVCKLKPRPKSAPKKPLVTAPVTRNVPAPVIEGDVKSKSDVIPGLSFHSTFLFLKLKIETTTTGPRSIQRILGTGL
jgi:hypothetical protein